MAHDLLLIALAALPSILRAVALAVEAMADARRANLGGEPEQLGRRRM